MISVLTMAVEPQHITDFAGLSGEELKAQLVPLDTTRSQDAMVGSSEHPMQRLVDRSTVDFFSRTTSSQERLLSERTLRFLSDPAQVRIIGCGRNEHGNGQGSLLNNLTYMADSTQRAGNVHFYDANSTDGSFEAAGEVPGVEVFQRQELAKRFDAHELAAVLGLDEKVFADAHVLGNPPLRKGWDIHLARTQLLRDSQQGKAPKTVIWTDTDLHSIPGGKAEDPDGQRTYLPIQLLGAAYTELEETYPESQPHLILTSSGKRNNEPIHAVFNTAHAMAAEYDPHDRTNAKTRAILESIALFGGIHGHPLTGELLTSTESEIHAPGATGQLVEVVRLLWHANIQYRLHQTTDPEVLQHVSPIAADVKRGPQERIDKPQTDDKEWWMINGVLPQGYTVILRHIQQSGRFFDEWTLDDYKVVNQKLSRISYMSRYDSNEQVRRFQEYPMERLIPPVSLLAKEGILHL